LSEYTIFPFEGYSTLITFCAESEQGMNKMKNRYFTGKKFEVKLQISEGGILMISKGLISKNNN